jgi:hypothetical protein
MTAGTVYRTITIDDAQHVVDSHPVGLDGLCVACRVDGCVGARAVALRRLGQENRLPRRRPGATRPERVGARRVA